MKYLLTQNHYAKYFAYNCYIGWTLSVLLIQKIDFPREKFRKSTHSSSRSEFGVVSSSTVQASDW